MRTDARPCRHCHHPGGGPQRLRIDRIVWFVHLVHVQKSPSAAATNAASGDPNLVFAQCMREKGFDVPDTGLTPENLKDTSDAFNSALNECMDKVSGMTGDDSVVNDQAARETLVKGAECLRGLGYDVKDPDG